MADQIIEYYTRTGVEQGRLAAGKGRLEFLRTLDVLQRFLPKPPARILDMGGGPGVYSFWLAEHGYTAHLVDLAPLHVEQARKGITERKLSATLSAEVGDARRFNQPDGLFDGVLLLGPLYHLTHRDDRIAALKECFRVLAPGGTLVCAAISRFASFMDGLSRGFLDDPKFSIIVRSDLSTGVHLNPTDRSEYFTTSYFHKPDELAGELGQAGFAVRAMVGVEGPAWLAPDIEARLADPAKQRQLLEILKTVETEPALIGASAHLLAVCTKS